VAFCSTADDLVTTDTNTSSDVFVRDLQNETTTLVSVNKDGADSGNSDSDEAEISANGQIVAFKSYADDLVNTDTNGITDVFVFEVQGAPHGCNCADPLAINGTSGRDFYSAPNGLTSSVVSGVRISLPAWVAMTALMAE
jgi:hypothetical protein